MKSFIASALLLASVVAALPQPSTKLAARGPVIKGMFSTPITKHIQHY
jgi:hypothetical protein